MGAVSSFFYTLFISSLSLTALASPSKVLLVSDIDDTIKVSHILSKSAALSRAVDITTPFTGMSQLYQLILNENPASTKVVYLSNAPDTIAGVPALRLSHQSFLNFNQFPDGELLLKDGIFDSQHKLNSLRELIETEKPEILILIGDNGEKDPQIYHQIVNEYSYLHLRTFTFIHQLYSAKNYFLVPDSLEEIGSTLFPEQIGFVTPVEISMKLKSENILAESSLKWMIDHILPYIVSEKKFKWDGLRPISFPGFMNCSDFVWPISNLTKQWPELSMLKKKIENECN